MTIFLAKSSTSGEPKWRPSKPSNPAASEITNRRPSSSSLQHKRDPSSLVIAWSFCRKAGTECGLLVPPCFDRDIPAWNVVRLSRNLSGR